VLHALVEARPRQLLAVRRERPVVGTTGAAKPDGAHPDYFSPIGKSEIAADGVIGTRAVQIEFSGRTAVLRDLLNRVAEMPLPVLVRGVEVEPMEKEQPRERRADGASVPVVLPGDSRFLVTLDVVESVRTRSATK
jgi:hypothetical protein